MSHEDQPNVIPPNPHIGGAGNAPPPHVDPMSDPKVMKRLAEMGGLMVTAPVAIKVVGEDGRPTEIKASLMDVLLQIAQGAPLASSLHPVRCMDEGRDVIQNTSVLQLLAEIRDSMNDLCCMAQEFLEANGIGDDDDEDEEEDDGPMRPPSRRRR